MKRKQPIIPADLHDSALPQTSRSIMFQALISHANGAWTLAWLAGAACTLATAALVGMRVYFRVRAQKSRLDTALNNICQGLTMFDRSGCLILCNQRYIEMYGLSADVIKPGCTVRQIVEHRIATGSLSPQEAARYVDVRRAALISDTTVTNVVELANRRTIMVTRRSMPGGGWVATHEDISEQRRAEAKIAHMAHHDALTDLPNRVLLRDRLDAALARVGRGEMLAVLYLDLDHFKRINDSLGHSVGDALLRSVAERLRGCLRETDTIARLGGDEFAVIQTPIAQPSDAAILAERIRNSIIAPYKVDDHQILADVSIGISIAPNDAASSDQLLKQADMALYQAKGDGRGAVRYFAPDMDARARARRALEFDLRGALAHDQFELHYQPLMNLERDLICGCEALLRWHHPERGVISPAEFIPIAEDTGLIVPLGQRVLAQACEQLGTWLAANPSATWQMSVNLSARQLLAPDLVANVQAAAEAAALQPASLILELTESVLLADSERVLQRLHRLKDLGVLIAIDDFGTGYSSLSYLQRVPFDILKIDRAFVAALRHEDPETTLVRTIMDLGRTLGRTAIAEGIEEQVELDGLLALGCELGQGMHFGSAVDAATLERDLNLLQASA